MISRRLPDGWAAWPLLLASVAPVLATGHVVWTALGGASDGIVQEDPPPSAAELVGNRWSTLWSGPQVTTLLVVALLPLLVLAAAAVAGRPVALVPRGVARRAATGLAAVTTLASIAGILGFCAQLLGVLPVRMWSGTPSKLDAFSVGATVVLATTVLGSVATAVLLPRSGTGSADDVADDLEGDEAVGDDHAEDPPSRRPVSAVVDAPPRPARAGLPRLRPEDVALYRRP
ncbi:hypothetical protein AB2L27_00455 [Kineococcus sp. LSe6-4]|uniref:Uncharacterized protein n=1 Tax=Kineococcus halophytocola TaxID=3234027 RepID=A0ABV4GV95_9ACTN